MNANNSPHTSPSRPARRASGRRAGPAADPHDCPPCAEHPVGAKWKCCLPDKALKRTVGDTAKSSLYLLGDPEHPEAVVRLKDIAQAADKEKFVAEAAIAERMGALGVAPALHKWYFSASDRVGVLVMDYIPMTLGTYLANDNKLTPKMTAQLIDHVETLAAEGYLCADVKPANILVDPDTDTLKLIDFGDGMCEADDPSEALAPARAEAMLVLARLYAWMFHDGVDILPGKTHFEHDATGEMLKGYNAQGLMGNYAMANGKSPWQIVKFAVEEIAAGKPWPPGLGG